MLGVGGVNVGVGVGVGVGVAGGGGCGARAARRCAMMLSGLGRAVLLQVRVAQEVVCGR